MPNSTLETRYNPKGFETQLYKLWEQQGCFEAPKHPQSKTYCIVMPPPNVTGSLHMGHALDHSIQDCLIRWRRMCGDSTLWLPGTDHAGIATQGVVERLLHQEGTSRLELGREAFLKRVWEWKNHYGEHIYKQMRALGNSCDWGRACFTLDAPLAKAVRHAFVHFYRKKLLYKSEKMVNWSPRLRSAISDLEVEYKTQKSTLWHISYPCERAHLKPLVIATTRPETLLGDTAVAVHPDDERYKAYHGQHLTLPLVGRRLSVIPDSMVEPQFGTGVVKITPAHDFNDYAMGQRHKLNSICILDKAGRIAKSDQVPKKYHALSIEAARKCIVQDLQSSITKTQHEHKVGFCSRSGCRIEPMLSEQWFLNTQTLAKKALAAPLEFVPSMWHKTYAHWLSNIEDWCVSRQLWWGHQIPAWYCQSCTHMQVSLEDPKQCEKCGHQHLEQDPDVLDTWFSSALWPMSTLGWPHSDPAPYYPTQCLVTGHDIIFFWVARMAMMGLEFSSKLPFKKVYIHGLVRDPTGRKMSKSLKNAVDPIELIEQYGADAVRLSLLISISQGRDIKFGRSNIEAARNFINKLWNAARFVLSTCVPEGKPECKQEGAKTPPLKSTNDLQAPECWILQSLQYAAQLTTKHLQECDFASAARRVRHFLWGEFCDFYLELIKPSMHKAPAQYSAVRSQVLWHVLDQSLRLLHPFCPFVTEHIYQIIHKGKGGFLMQQKWPQDPLDIDSTKVQEVSMLSQAVSGIRKLKARQGWGPHGKPVVKVFAPSTMASAMAGASTVADVFKKYQADIVRLGVLKDMEFCAEPLKNAAQYSLCGSDVFLHIEALEHNLTAVDVEKLKTKWTKKHQKLQQLLSPEFKKKAPKEVVERKLKELESVKKQLQSLTTRAPNTQI